MTHCDRVHREVVPVPLRKGPPRFELGRSLDVGGPLYGELRALRNLRITASTLLPPLTVTPSGVLLTSCSSAARPDQYLARSAPATRGCVSSKRLLRSDTRSPINAWVSSSATYVLPQAEEIGPRCCRRCLASALRSGNRPPRLLRSPRQSSRAIASGRSQTSSGSRGRRERGPRRSGETQSAG